MAYVRLKRVTVLVGYREADAILATLWKHVCSGKALEFVDVDNSSISGSYICTTVRGKTDSGHEHRFVLS